MSTKPKLVIVDTDEGPEATIESGDAAPIADFQGDYRWLSNFYYCLIEYEGMTYRSTEHAFQAAKTLDQHEREKIRIAPSPAQAKKLGRQVTLREGWDEMRDGVMLQITRAKYRDTELRKKLRDTGDAKLVEGNTWGDTYWGVCNGVGENRLGQTLMRVREELRDKNPLPDMALSPDQANAMSQIQTWLQSPEQILTFGGYAGTGKTTLIRQVLALCPGAAVVAFTGKAVSVLQRKGIAEARTLHSLIYEMAGGHDDYWYQRECIGCAWEGRVDDCKEDGTLCPECNNVVRRPSAPPLAFRPVERIHHKVVIVDEASMINKQLHEDLERLAPKILYVGDHGQLEPIGYDPGLMKNPTVRLEKIHRQAEGSEIVRFAHYLRRGGDPTQWAPSPEVVVARRVENEHEYDVVLCGFNNTRQYYNREIRSKRGYTGSLPNPGEILICLHNNRELGVFNGMQITVDKCYVNQRDPNGALVVYRDFSGQECEIPIYRPQLGSTEKHHHDPKARKKYGLFDWGYVLTCHKSQGSEWDKVCVIEETHSGWNGPRWRYTASTRAAKELTYVVQRAPEKPPSKLWDRKNRKP